MHKHGVLNLSTTLQSRPGDSQIRTVSDSFLNPLLSGCFLCSSTLSALAPLFIAQLPHLPLST